MTIEITGSMAGHADRHTESSLAESFENAYFTAPWDIYEGPLKDFPKKKIRLEAEPLVLFAHGSSGIGEPLKAFGRWLASFGIGFLCPNSFVLKDRITYTSPVSRDDYERIHVMRSAELANAAARLTEVPGFDGRYIVAGTSEGGVAAARFQAPQGQAECARMIFSWPCEDNYHVAAHRTAIPQDMPVLNVMSAADKFFSQANSWLDNPLALGHAGRTLANHTDASIVLIPGAPHTLFALPQTQSAVECFLERVLEL